MLKKIARRLGISASKTDTTDGDPLERADIAAIDRDIVRAASNYTMTGPLRSLALVDAVRYCVARGIPGDFAECGVWRGGSVLAMILTLQDMGVDNRDIWLYDTFEGMTLPTEHDTSAFEQPALETWQASQGENKRAWENLFHPDVFNEEMVRKMLLSTGYPAERIHFVRGPVEETLDQQPPGDLALLRLDTDWYESTRCEMELLYPLLQTGGVLIIDDYGHWEGARKAVDEYFAAGRNQPLLLQRVDYTGRMAIKN